MARGNRWTGCSNNGPSSFRVVVGLCVQTILIDEADLKSSLHPDSRAY
jgi:hypothetical protein